MRIIAAGFAVALFAGFGAAATAQDRSTPEATVRTFLGAFHDANTVLASSCVKGGETAAGPLAALAKLVSHQPLNVTLTDVKSAVTGSTATLDGSIHVDQPGGPADHRAYPTHVALAMAGGSWLIVPDASRAAADNPDVVNALAYMMTNLKLLSQARDSARKVSCLSNVRQLCLGVMMFATDHDEVITLRAATWGKAIMPYVKNRELFRCPADGSGKPTYAFNAHMAGVSLAKLKSPAKTILIYEGSGGRLVFRHGGKAAVGFTDGHAEMLTAAQVKWLRWLP